MKISRYVRVIAGGTAAAIALGACGSAGASAVSTAGSQENTADEKADRPEGDAAASIKTTLPEGLEWLTPFEETVTLNVVVGWDADSSIKEGTTPETNSLVQIAKDYLNIDLNFLWMVPEDQFEDRLALQLSSGEIPDVLMLTSENFYEFLDSKYLRDLTDAYETCASDELKNAVTSMGDAPVQFSSREGKLYGIPAVLNPIESVAGLYYRSDWLDAVGMEKPSSMEEVNDMLVKFAEYGPSVNGGKSVAGLGTVSSVLNTNFALNGYFQGYGAYPNKWIMRDGKLVNGMVQDEILDALNGLKELYDRGVLAPDFATWDFDQFSQHVTTDQVGAAFGTYYIPAWPLNQNKDANPDADWEEIDLAELGGKSKPAMNQTGIVAFNVVTKNAPKNAEEALVKLLNLGLAVNENCTVDTSIFGGMDQPENGADVFYLPVYVYYPTPWEQYREDIWAAYEAKDRDSLQLDYEKELYDDMADWLTNGNDSSQRGTSWGMYKSRLEKDMGIAIGLKDYAAGSYETNYFYGGATKTEQRVSATLSDISTSFVIDYILGEKTEADWEEFKKNWNDLGGADWTAEVNEQYTQLTKQ